jgi:hypothetical protein
MRGILPTRLSRQSIVLFMIAITAWSAAARAKPARCTTTDDGDYACSFTATDKDGSFQISAPGKPLYILNMDEPGKAFGFVNLGNRNISLPDAYIRSTADPACWVNDATQARICAR